MEYTTLKFEEPKPGLGILTFNRPDRLNAVNSIMLQEMHAFLDDMSRPEQHVRVLIFTGAGKGFCAGADLQASIERGPDHPGRINSAGFLTHIMKPHSDMIYKIRRLPQPVISVVNGAAAGAGFSIALASDVIIVGPKAKFIASYINIGLSGGELGTSFFLPRHVGSRLASEILMTGRAVEAEEAYRIGLANRLVSADELIPTAAQIADAMLSKNPIGLRLTKEALVANAGAANLENALELENRHQAICAFTPGMMEAIAAFANKK